MNRFTPLALLLLAACAQTPADDAVDLEPATPDLSPRCTPQPEECNLVDDDCDGIVDEGCPVLAGTTGVLGADVRFIGDSLFVWLGGTHRTVVDLVTNHQAPIADGTVGPLQRKLLNTDGIWQLQDQQAINLRTGATADSTVDERQYTSVDDGVAVGRTNQSLVRWHLADGTLETHPMAEPFSYPVASGSWLAIVDKTQRPHRLRFYRNDDLTTPIATREAVGDVELGALDGAFGTALWSEHSSTSDRVWSVDLVSGQSHPIADDLHPREPRGSGTLACFVAKDGALWITNVQNALRLRIAGRGIRCDVQGTRIAWIVPYELSQSTYGAVYVRALTSEELDQLQVVTH